MGVPWLRAGSSGLLPRVSLLAVVLAGTAACATTGRGPVAEQPDLDDVYGGNVTAVRALDGRSYEITQTPRDDTGCYRSPTTTMTEQLPEAVYITSTYRVSRPACPVLPLRTTATLDADLGKRLLVIDQRAWTPDRAPGAARGALRQCHEKLGCDPQLAKCDADFYRLALDVGDFPRNGRYATERACAVPWLILDVDTTRSACGAIADDPSANPCLAGPARITRWVFTHRGPVWDTVNTLPLSGGCGPTPPSGLPRELCRTLPAVEKR